MVDLHKQDGCIRNDIDKAIADAVDECAFIKGTEVGTFEAELAHYVNAKYCISCGNGTDAITLALMAVGLRPGDEVIVPAFSFVAAAEAVALLGGKPVFADIDPRTFNIDCESVERVVSKRTKAIIPVHLFGQPCNMTGLMKIASNTGIVLIEDNAQSLGAKCIFPDGSKQFAGPVGTIGCTSFFPSKILGCYGDGGAVFTDSRELAEKIKALASHGQSIKYRHEYIGLNSRLDTVQAAVLRVKLPHVDKWIFHGQTVSRVQINARKCGMPLPLGNLPISVRGPVDIPFTSPFITRYGIKEPIRGPLFNNLISGPDGLPQQYVS